jgi:hypothetical protein
MRPKFSVWSDYGAPAQKPWMSAPKRGTRTSIGPLILLAAVVVVAGVIGIGGIYPQIIDAEWVQGTSTRLPKMSLSSLRAIRKRSGIVAAIPLGAVGPAVSSRLALAPELSQLRTTVIDVEPPAETASPLAVAAIPTAEAKAEATAAKTAAPKPGKKPKVAEKKVVRVVEHQRGYSGAYAQYGGGWDGWAGGGWSGFQPIGNYRRF